MAANSKRETLNGTYTLLVLAAESSFLIQAIGVTPVRIVAVASGGGIPADGTLDYFSLDSSRSGSDAITREGLEGADIYARSGVNGLEAFVTRMPS